MTVRVVGILQSHFCTLAVLLLFHYVCIIYRVIYQKEISRIGLSHTNCLFNTCGNFLCNVVYRYSVV